MWTFIWEFLFFDFKLAYLNFIVVIGSSGVSESVKNAAYSTDSLNTLQITTHKPTKSKKQTSYV
jgi:hypothetical protein